MEKRISAVEDQTAGEITTLNDMTKEMDLLKNKLTKFEAHSKINNMVLVGLEEGAEAGDPDKMVKGILSYILD